MLRSCRGARWSHRKDRTEEVGIPDDDIRTTFVSHWSGVLSVGRIHSDEETKERVKAAQVKALEDREVHARPG